MKSEFEQVAYVFQGGGALGSYQAGIYEALHEAHIEPHWIAGISIGSINSAVIAGNAPEKRIDALKGLWNELTQDPYLSLLTQTGHVARKAFNQSSANQSIISGVPAFFKPHTFSPFFYPDGREEAVSYYSTTALRSTLEKYIDFDRINMTNPQEKVRLSLGAVNVRTGNFVYFDNSERHLGPEHVMASGALPPAFPPVKVDGEYYWDGGVVSNTPLDWIFKNPSQGVNLHTLIIQVDLWSALGHLPSNIQEVMTRYKEIQYSSRTRSSVEALKIKQRDNALMRRLLQKLPEEYAKTAEGKELWKNAQSPSYSIVLCVYQSSPHELQSRDYNFSKLSAENHWKEGLADAQKALRHKEIFTPPTNEERISVFDFRNED